jgi:outer membrane protein assembly factor BamB
LGSSLRLIWSETVTDQERTLHGKTVAPPVVAQGMVFVAAPDAHHVSALDADSGRLRWRFLLGGRVEAPPTIFKGLCLLGANDGWVYCLRAADGELLWRFRAAPREQRIMAYGRLESPWPVPGVLVESDIAYFAAGRHGRGDEGIYLYAVDPFMGKVLWEKCWRNIDFWDSGFMVNDVLVSNGKSIFMSLWMYDPGTGEKNGKWQGEQYLRSGTGNQKVAVMSQGFLYDRKDGVWLERYDATYWYCRGASALLLAFTDDRIFGITTDRKMRPDFELFAKRCGDAADPEKDAPLWSTRVPAGTQALLPAGSTLFVAGPGDKANPKGGMLWSYSVADGSKLSELRFGDAPVFDGLAAANGRLYLSTQGGKILCFGGK